MKIILETDRLSLREMTPSDLSAICRVLQDRETMYAYEHAFSHQEVQEWLDKQLQRYAQDGFGLWAVLLRQTGELIGQCGLTWQDWNGRQVLEVGYLFQRSAWHQGYATEAALACRDHAFSALGAQEVFAIIRDNNTASQAVARRLGMTLVGDLVKHYYHMDLPHLVYSIRAKPE